MSADVWTVWASHEKVRAGEWLPLVTNLSGSEAVREVVTRQDRVRRNGQPCRFKALPEGESPMTTEEGRN